MPIKNWGIRKGIANIVDDIKEPRSTVYEWTKSERFSNQFGVFGRDVEHTGKAKGNEMKSMTTWIVRNVLPATYDIAKCCVKNFPAFLKLDPSDEIKRKQITGTDIIEYNNSILNEIDNLMGFEKQLLLAQPSIKYAKVMNKYYDMLLDSIALVSTICIDTYGDYSPRNIEMILENLKQVTWYNTVEKTLGRVSNNISQFNVNTAFKDVMNMFENEYMYEDPSSEEQLRSCEEKDLEGKRQEIIDAYYTEVAKKIPDDEITQEFYKKIENDANYEKNYFGMYRKNFFMYSMGDINKREIALKGFLNCVDMYGRVLVPVIVEKIDEDLEMCQVFISMLKCNDYIDYELILKIKRFIANVKYYEDSFGFDKYIYQITSGEKLFLKECQIDKAICGYELLCDWLIESNEETLRALNGNLAFVEIYLKFCAAVHAWRNFDNIINSCNEEYDNMYKEFKKDNVYKNLRGDIDRFIGQKWRHYIFEK